MSAAQLGAVRVLREALRDAEMYPDGHRDHYRRVLRPIEEIGVECEVCGDLIDASDILAYMQEEGPQVGPEAAAGTSWTCVDCGGADA